VLSTKGCLVAGKVIAGLAASSGILPSGYDSVSTQLDADCLEIGIISRLKVYETFTFLMCPHSYCRQCIRNVCIVLYWYW